MIESVRWGVMGCAQIAINRVIPAMPDANVTTLKAVASRSLEKAQRVAAQFDVPKAYGSYEDVLNDPEIDAAEAREVQAVRDETGLYCLEAFAYRFNPVVARAFEIARSGVLGDLRFMHTISTFLMEKPYEPANVRLRADIGGGALYDMGCYAINAQRMIADREPLTAWSAMTWSERFDVDMSGTANLDFGDDLRGTIQWGFNAPYGGPFSVIGEEGRLTGTYGWGPPAGEPAMILTVGGETEEIFVEHANDYTGEVEDLSEGIRGIEEPAYADEPLDANMRVIDACYLSNRTGEAEPV